MAIKLPERADRPVSRTGQCMYVFKNELVAAGWNKHKAGWMLWSHYLGIPLHRVICDTEEGCLGILEHQITMMTNLEELR